MIASCHCLTLGQKGMFTHILERGQEPKSATTKGCNILVSMLLTILKNGTLVWAVQMSGMSDNGPEESCKIYTVAEMRYALHLIHEIECSGSSNEL